MEMMPLDRLTRMLANPLTRRGLGSIFGLSAFVLPGLTEAKEKRKRRRERKKKVAFNDFGCVNVGSFCQNSSQCCSGICEGKKEKKTCQAHDTSTCQAGQTGTLCGGANVTCADDDGGEGTCHTTTGNAPYCRGSGSCFPAPRIQTASPSAAPVPPVFPVRCSAQRQGPCAPARASLIAASSH